MEEAPSRWTLVERLNYEKGIYECSCGVRKELWHRNVRSGASRSCGCYNVESLTKRATRHGHRRTGGRTTPTYETWRDMRKRCGDRKCKHYANYGGRGITVCERWQVSFENFLADMGERPEGDISLDRIDVNGNYEPGNCRWATRVEQANNKRNNVMLTLNGVTKSQEQWAKELNLSHGAIVRRIKAGWPIERVLDPVRQKTGPKPGWKTSSTSTAN